MADLFQHHNAYRIDPGSKAKGHMVFPRRDLMIMLVSLFKDDLAPSTFYNGHILPLCHG